MGAGAEAADLVLANEYLDALPVHRLVQADGLREAFVGWDGWFGELIDAPSTPALAAHLEADGVELREGQQAEVCLAAPAWLARVATELGPGGIVLVIDYGHDAAELYGSRRMAGTLLTYRGHEVSDDPFTAVGHTDMTAHVDITALEDAAREVGLGLVGSTKQGPFLARLGLGDLLAELGRRPGIEPAIYLEARAAVARLEAAAPAEAAALPAVAVRARQALLVQEPMLTTKAAAAAGQASAEHFHLLPPRRQRTDGRRRGPGNEGSRRRRALHRPRHLVFPGEIGYGPHCAFPSIDPHRLCSYRLYHSWVSVAQY